MAPDSSSPWAFVWYAHPRMVSDGTRRQFLGGIATASALAALPHDMGAAVGEGYWQSVRRSYSHSERSACR